MRAPLLPLLVLVAWGGWAGAVERDDAADGPELVADLQTMGVPARVFLPRQHLPDLTDIDDPGGRFVDLYRLQPARPTAAGARVLEVLRRLSRRERARLQFRLARAEYAELAEAVRLLEKAGAVEEAGQAGAYPEVPAAYSDRAAEVLRLGESEPTLGDADSDPADVRRVLTAHRRELAGRLAALSRSGGSTDRLKAAVEALDALSGEAGAGYLRHEGLLGIVQTLPKERLSEAQWQALASAFPMGDSLNRMGILPLWRAGVTGRGVKVAVIDDGVDAGHPDLRGSVVDARNFAAERVLEGPRAGRKEPRGEHGTRVAGIIHALAPEAEIRSYKVIGATDTTPAELQQNEFTALENVAKALRCARRDGCTVANISLGWPVTALGDSDPLSRAISARDREGLVTVVASGNEGEDTVNTPGYARDALSVGRVDYSKRQHPTSTVADVFLPARGGAPARIVPKPDCLAYGGGICSARLDPTGDYSDPDSIYSRDHGTSFAAPHAAAATALLQHHARRAGVALSAAEARRTLLDSCAPHRGGSHGAGVIDPAAACARIDARAREVPAPR